MADRSLGLTLPCIVCKKELEPAFRLDPHNQPSAGVVFKSYGNYGSTVFDQSPTSRNWLEVNVCDACLIERYGYVWHASPAPPSSQPVLRTYWRGEAED